MDIIVFGSLHGSARRYAERLSDMTGIGAVSFDAVKNIADYDRVIYIGAIYAGCIRGLKKTVSHMTDTQQLFVASVGVADPADEENVRNIRTFLRGTVPAPLYDDARVFHLRGAIDYSRLSLVHRLLLSMLKSKASKMPEEELNAESRAILSTYGGKHDFVDFSCLEPIVAALR